MEIRNYSETAQTRRLKVRKDETHGMAWGASFSVVPQGMLGGVCVCVGGGASYFAQKQGPRIVHFV